MDNYIECRVFKLSVGWADVIFYFPIGLTFKEVKKIPKCIPLTVYDYIEKFKFSKDYLELIDKDTINDKPYYYTYYVPNNMI